MVTPAGGFASAQDADSEGEEGKFFVWTPDAARRRARHASTALWAAEWFGVTAEGNFEHGQSALWRTDPPERGRRAAGRRRRASSCSAMREARVRLFAERAKRVQPGTDDKVLASWNGLMISALAQAYQVLGETRYLDAARAAARYVLEGLRQEDGRLFATARNGRAHLNAYLDDYAFMIQGADRPLRVRLRRPLAARGARLSTRSCSSTSRTRQHGGYFTTGDDHEALIARLKTPHDGALPSGNGVQALNLLRLAELTGQGDARRARRAHAALRGRQILAQHPPSFSQILLAADFLAAGPREIVIAGEPSHPEVRAMLAEVRGRFLPQRVVALARRGADEELIPLLAERGPSEQSGARAYVCQNYACQLPVETAAALAEQLDDS